MRDDLLDHAAQNTVTADAFSTSAVEVNKTPTEGIWIEVVASRDGADADETLQVAVYAKDTDASWDILTDDLVGGTEQLVAGDFDGANALVRYILVQTKRKYIKLYYNVAGTTPDYDIESWSIVSGPRRESGA